MQDKPKQMPKVRVREVKPDLDYGLYLWKLPTGKFFKDDDGNYLNELIHPKFSKTKTYIVKLNKELAEADLAKLKAGIQIGDSRPSKFQSIIPLPRERLGEGFCFTLFASWRIQSITNTLFNLLSA